MTRRILSHFGTLFIFAVLFSVFSAHSVFAEENLFTAAVDKELYNPGDKLKLSISVPADNDIGGFLIKVSFDDTVLSYSKEVLSADAYKYTNVNQATLTSVISSKSAALSGLITEFQFRLQDTDVPSQITVTISDIYSNSGTLIKQEEKHIIPINFAEGKSDEALLYEIIPSSGTINETVSPSTFNYTINVPYSTKTMSFDCTVSDGASWRVNRKNLGSGGSTTDFSIIVTAEDGITKNTYTISITRGEYQPGSSEVEVSPTPFLLSLAPSSGSLYPEFDPETTSYSVSVPYSVSQMEFYCTVQDGISYRVNRKNLGSGGSTTDFTITVTAEDGVTKNYYYIAVTRGPYQRNPTVPTVSETPLLLSLIPSNGILSPEFNPEINSYTINVPYEIKEMYFNCTVSSGASYKVNRKNLGSGGSTTEFKITVTAEDEITKNIYIVSVTRGEYVRTSSGSSVSSSSSRSRRGSASSSDSDNETDVSDTYVITKYENSGALTIQSDGFIPLLIGVGIGLLSVMVIMLAVILGKKISEEKRSKK